MGQYLKNCFLSTQPNSCSINPCFNSHSNWCHRLILAIPLQAHFPLIICSLSSNVWPTHTNCASPCSQRKLCLRMLLLNCDYYTTVVVVVVVAPLRDSVNFLPQQWHAKMWPQGTITTSQGRSKQTAPRWHQLPVTWTSSLPWKTVQIQKSHDVSNDFLNKSSLGQHVNMSQYIYILCIFSILSIHGDSTILTCKNHLVNAGKDIWKKMQKKVDMMHPFKG